MTQWQWHVQWDDDCGLLLFLYFFILVFGFLRIRFWLPQGKGYWWWWRWRWRWWWRLKDCCTGMWEMCGMNMIYYSYIALSRLFSCIFPFSLFFFFWRFITFFFFSFSIVLKLDTFLSLSSLIFLQIFVIACLISLLFFLVFFFIHDVKYIYVCDTNISSLKKILDVLLLLLLSFLGKGLYVISYFWPFFFQFIHIAHLVFSCTCTIATAYEE